MTNEKADEACSRWRWSLRTGKISCLYPWTHEDEIVDKSDRPQETFHGFLRFFYV